ncbi:hypothetical protein SAMN05880570_0313 [Paenibacillus sp. RU4T]|nr:hypothetical protein SAMN05880555_0313 [Paenibacillus sp. RU4X]SIQ20523.1 hypothetical protein SAMN05880570_0313 [Paenibacillus sp. RU4T]
MLASLLALWTSRDVGLAAGALDLNRCWPRCWRSGPREMAYNFRLDVPAYRLLSDIRSAISPKNTRFLFYRTYVPLFPIFYRFYDRVDTNNGSYVRQSSNEGIVFQITDPMSDSCSYNMKIAGATPLDSCSPFTNTPIWDGETGRRDAKVIIALGRNANYPNHFTPHLPLHRTRQHLSARFSALIPSHTSSQRDVPPTVRTLPCAALYRYLSASSLAPHTTPSIRTLPCIDTYPHILATRRTANRPYTSLRRVVPLPIRIFPRTAHDAIYPHNSLHRYQSMHPQRETPPPLSAASAHGCAR